MQILKQKTALAHTVKNVIAYIPMITIKDVGGLLEMISGGKNQEKSCEDGGLIILKRLAQSLDSIEKSIVISITNPVGRNWLILSNLLLKNMAACVFAAVKKTGSSFLSIISMGMETSIENLKAFLVFLYGLLRIITPTFCKSFASTVILLDRQEVEKKVHVRTNYQFN